MTIQECAEKVLEIYNQHEEAAEWDAGFDAGEFSGPAHADMAERQAQDLMESLGKEHGFTTEQIWDEVMRMTHEEPTPEEWAEYYEQEALYKRGEL